MKTGEVIRKYRKQKELTQEEMAARLGVTAPAVNKWENGNSLPDIALLAPIARLLGVSLEELLSFREELTEEEIRALLNEPGASQSVQPGIVAGRQGEGPLSDREAGADGLSL